jgi:hypothetical protein
MKKIPIQVYLDARDRRLLDELSARHGLSMAEIVRLAIRRWSRDERMEEDPVLALIGTLDNAALPPDLSTRHDEYAVRAEMQATARVAERPGGGEA